MPAFSPRVMIVRRDAQVLHQPGRVELAGEHADGAHDRVRRAPDLLRARAPPCTRRWRTPGPRTRSPASCAPRAAPPPGSAPRPAPSRPGCRCRAAPPWRRLSRAAARTAFTTASEPASLGPSRPRALPGTIIPRSPTPAPSSRPPPQPASTSPAGTAARASQDGIGLDASSSASVLLLRLAPALVQPRREVRLAAQRVHQPRASPRAGRCRARRR